MISRDPFGRQRRGYHHGRLKDALIDAARHLVAERGSAGFTLAEAAKRVGVTAAAPYRHFTDRNDLMDELARRGFTAFSTKLAEAYGEGQPDAVSALQRVGDAYLSFAEQEPGLYRTMFGDVAALATPASGAAADRALEVLRRGSVAILRLYSAPEMLARDLALQVWSLSHGIAMLTLSGHLGTTPDTDPRRMLRDSAGSLIEMAIRRSGGVPPNAPR